MNSELFITAITQLKFKLIKDDHTPIRDGLKKLVELSTKGEGGTIGQSSTKKNIV